MANKGFQQLCLVFFFYVLAFTASEAQRPFYKVVKIAGEVIHRPTGKPLIEKQEFGAKDPLAFKTGKDFLIVVNEKSSTILIMPSHSLFQSTEQVVNVPLDYYHFSLDFMDPSFKVESLDSADLYQHDMEYDSINLINFLKKHNKLLLLNGKFQLLANPKVFPINDKLFFFLSYDWNANKITKKLPKAGNNIVIDKQNLYLADLLFDVESEKQPIVSLFYCNTIDRITIPIGNFHIGTVDSIKLEQEIKTLIDVYTSTGAKEIEKKVRAYLVNLYGQVDEHQFQEWYKNLK